MKYFLLALLLSSPARAADYGILLLAHGGAPEWNDEIARIGKTLGAQAPTQVALGMADAGELQKAIGNLEAEHVKKIVAVPLFINSASEVMDQTRYVLGLREKPSEILKEALERMAREHAGHPGMTHNMTFSTQRVKTWLPVVLTSALDEHPAVVEVLYDRAKALSQEPERETIILVGHGPVDDKANQAWLKTMTALDGRSEKRGLYRLEGRHHPRRLRARGQGQGGQGPQGHRHRGLVRRRARGGHPVRHRPRRHRGAHRRRPPRPRLCLGRPGVVPAPGHRALGRGGCGEGRKNG